MSLPQKPPKDENLNTETTKGTKKNKHEEHEENTTTEDTKFLAYAQMFGKQLRIR